MKHVIGFILILFSIPILFVVQEAIAVELKSAGSFNDQMNDSIKLSAPKVNVPVTLKDGNGLIFAEEYIEWRDPLPCRPFHYLRANYS